MQPEPPTMTLDTAEQSAPERFEYWRQSVSETFVPLMCEPSTDASLNTFNGRLRTIPLGDLQVTEVSATPHVVRRTRTLISRSGGEFYKVTLQTAGDALLVQDDREAQMRTGDFAIYDTTRPYKIRLGPSYRSLVLVIPRRSLQLSPEQIAQVTARSMSGRRGAGTLLAESLTRIAVDPDQYNPSTKLRLASPVMNMAYALLAEHIEAGVCPESHRSVSPLQVKQFIEEHLGDLDLDCERIAKEHHISRCYLQKIFREEGDSVAGWIRSRRLERCRRDLQDPLLARCHIAEICARWGIPDPAHFSKAFRAAYEVSPRGYRLDALRGSGQ